MRRTGRSVKDLVDWINVDHREGIDPVVAAGMAHYQFETLHPFYDGNGRVGRLLVVMQLLMSDVLSEPTLSVSPWFEARRTEYDDRLFAGELTWRVGPVDRLLQPRARELGCFHAPPDAPAAFTVKQAAADLDVGYSRANTLIAKLVQLEVLGPVRAGAAYGRRFYAPAVTAVLLQR